MRFPAVVPVLLVAATCAPLTCLHAQDQGRPDVGGTEAAVVAGHPLAAAAGARVLRDGGNAVDAAITMAAIMAVVRPHMNGIGGDAFMLIRDGASGQVVALNGSGRAGSRAIPAFFAERGLEEIPSRGPQSVSVPGAVQAWADALHGFGTIELEEALAPAIRYARDGFPVSSRLASDIQGARRRIEADPVLAAVFLPGGAAPTVGSLLRQPDLARSLEAVARGGADAFYRGEIADHIVEFMNREDGLVTAEDLAAHTSTWQEPIATTYHGKTVLAFPPNTQGLALLMQLNMAERLDLRALGLNSPPYVDRLVRIKRLVFADRDRYITDPEWADIPVDRLISKEYAAEKIAELDATDTPRDDGATADPSDSRREHEHDTIFLCVVDADGNAVSLIESNFASFGSARMVPGTGMILHNRGSLFSLDPNHVNVVAPSKRTYHTLSPHMVLDDDGSLFMVLGTPGGDGQTQTVTQVLNKILLFGLSPQQAVEHPRWRSYSTRLSLEPGLAGATAQVLQAMGHPVTVRPAPSSEFGGAQVIMITPEGALLTGADPRREAYGLAW